jgi:hypothetical protein
LLDADEPVVQWAVRWSRGAFELQAEQIRDLAEQCPAHRARSPEAHCCAELDIGLFRTPPDKRWPYAELHAELCR